MQSDLQKKTYFNGNSDSCSVQENFNLIALFIQNSVEMHILSKSSRSVFSVPWINPEIRRKIHRELKLIKRQKRRIVANFVINLNP